VLLVLIAQEPLAHLWVVAVLEVTVLLLLSQVHQFIMQAVAEVVLILANLEMLLIGVVQAVLVVVVMAEDKIMLILVMELPILVVAVVVVVVLQVLDQEQMVVQELLFLDIQTHLQFQILAEDYQCQQVMLVQTK
jgi:hypothetical protein